jgi:addiction module HigA family antidote
MRPIHPGEILKEEFLVPLGVSARALALSLGVPVNRVTGIINGQRSVTGDTALRLSLCLGTTPEFWMNLQSAYDLTIARKRKKEIASSVQPLARASA